MKYINQRLLFYYDIVNHSRIIVCHANNVWLLIKADKHHATDAHNCIDYIAIYQPDTYSMRNTKRDMNYMTRSSGRHYFYFMAISVACILISRIDI